jgi:CO dehydrogenase nickel-insertion accessory protein CooC1
MKGRAGGAKEGLSCWISAAVDSFFHSLSTVSHICCFMDVSAGVAQLGNWTYDRFNVVHQVVECDKRKLGFEVRVFAQMSTGMT